MNPPRDRALERAGRDCTENVAASRTSIDQSVEHVRQSKGAIERSLRLLKETAPKSNNDPRNSGH